jgi:hypothetical protein
MPAAVYDLFIEQGATFVKTITWNDSAGTPVDLTGYTARMQFRSSVNSSTILFSATTENSRITLGGALGTIDITFSATDTTAFAFVSAVYDLELQSGTGFVTRLLEGGVEVSKEVTR